MKVLARRKDEIRVVIERFKVSPGNVREKLADSIEVTFKEGENRLIIINAETGEEKEFNKFYECCGIRYEEPEPRFFSFNIDMLDSAICLTVPGGAADSIASIKSLKRIPKFGSWPIHRWKPAPTWKPPPKTSPTG